LQRAALKILTTVSLDIFVTEFMGALAEGLRKHGQVEEALFTINQAIVRATDCGSTFDMAELLRIKAQILAAIPQYGRDSTINYLTEAIAVAKAQSALALELRSTIDLARVLAEGGQRDEARHDLALLYGRFTEGFETADLRAARRLMAELA
jgi:predicted ATPase